MPPRKCLLRRMTGTAAGGLTGRGSGQAAEARWPPSICRNSPSDRTSIRLAALVQLQDAARLAGEPAGAQVGGHEPVPHHQHRGAGRDPAFGPGAELGGADLRLRPRNGQLAR